MEQIFGEIRAAVRGNAWILALFGILAIPDICAALGSADGKTSGQKYRDWIDANLRAKYTGLDAGELYRMRCSMLHQASSNTARYERIIFVAPGPVRMHNNVINNALNLDLPTFAEDIITAASDWLAANRDTEPVKTNLASIVRWYPDGFRPYVGRMPVLT